jgi:ADP-ribose pyrophosphatase YjhB (NUDIX family)
MKEIPRVTVGALIFNPKGELFLMKSPKWENQYICPGGHIEFNEKLPETVIREIKEETNLDVTDIKFVCVLEFINPKDFCKKNKHFVGIQFSCNVIGSQKVRLDKKEGRRYIWIKPKKALKKSNVHPPTKDALKIYLKKKKI